MPLVHGCTKFKYPIPGKFDPSSGTHGEPIWATGCRYPSKMTAEPSLVFVDEAGLDSRQRYLLRRFATALERRYPMGSTITITTCRDNPADTGHDQGFLDNLYKFDTATRPTMKNYHRNDQNFVRYCETRFERIERLFAKYLRSRGADAPNKASCRPNCNDLLLSPETLATLTGGNRSVWFRATVPPPVGGIPVGGFVDTPAVGPLGVSATYCLSDFLVSGTTNAGGGPALTPDDILIEVFVNGQLRKDFAGGLVRSASNCNTLCGWCVCVGALENIFFRFRNRSVNVISTASIEMQTQRWFPGEDGYVCPSCSCVTKHGKCGCKKRPPLSHHPRPGGVEVDIDIKDSTDVDVDVDVDEEGSD